MDGTKRLRDAGAITVTLGELADDINDYIAMRPETKAVLDGFASFMAGLRPGVPPAAHGRAQFVRTLLPGEADDVANGAPAERWVTVYEQLLDAADATGLGLDVHVHLLSRLTFWQTRASDYDLAGRRSGAAAVPADIPAASPARAGGSVPAQ